MTNALLIDKIYLTETEQTELVFTNIKNVNAYFDLHVHSDEISPAVLYSYYVDYYLSQVLNGGIAQFAYNSRWNSGMLHYVEFGLAEMGATQHLELLEEIADVIMGQIGIDNFINFTQQNLLNKNKIHDKLNRLTDKFLQINKKENLEILNNQFLQHHADTVFISHQEFKQFLQKLKQNPMLQARQNEHLEQLPSHVRYIRQLCDEHGCELLHIMDKENDEHWHFFTSRGRFFMVEQGDNVVMMTYHNPEIVARINK